LPCQKLIYQKIRIKKEQMEIGEFVYSVDIEDGGLLKKLYKTTIFFYICKK